MAACLCTGACLTTGICPAAQKYGVRVGYCICPCHNQVWMGLYPPTCWCQCAKPMKDNASIIEELKGLKMMVSRSEFDDLLERVNGLQKEFRSWGDGLKKQIEAIMAQIPDEIEVRKGERKPYGCPVCNCAGEWELQSIEETMRNGGNKIKKCHGCDGKGLVWG